MTPSTGKRTKTQRVFRNRAVYRHSGIVETHEIRADIVAECVPLWRECAKRANSRYGGDKPGGNHYGRSAALRCVDDVLREHRIDFLRDPRLWASYEREVRRAAQGAR